VNDVVSHRTPRPARIPIRIRVRRRLLLSALAAIACAADSVFGAAVLALFHHPTLAAATLYTGVVGTAFVTCWVWAGRR
jgi:hypothetical protein